ncbi:Alpha/Beta hydrolase protein [Leucosporidium creatinivorum]|uniref:Alpha/Beta hydrolase protein n=1 Tax=Leucosporidium creatinivorum TaxID=106004 RepID=A0A1Y2DQZ0_9BASI|nr:Alpha/Beta hydrolase protein [Leucosporidium creatinivorum]
MEQLPAFGTHVFQSVQPTFELYATLLRPQLPSLLEPVEHVYGEHPRHKVDVYRDGRDEEQLPVLIFVHGGGLNRGDKRMPNGLIQGAHQNVGSFFAKEGFLTLVPNYRLAGDHQGAATFPSGGEDVSLLLRWLSQQQTTLHFDPSRVFLLGNSAGAVHVATFLYADALSSLSPPLAADQARPLSAEEPAALKVRAAVFLSMPAEFSAAVGPRTPTLQGYFGGGPEVIADRCPVGLRKRSKDQTEILIALAELDPEDEILTPNQHLCDAMDSLPDPPKYDKLFIAGHNHISVPLGLSVSEKEEKWGKDVAAWLLARSSTGDKQEEVVKRRM